MTESDLETNAESARVSVCFCLKPTQQVFYLAFTLLSFAILISSIVIYSLLLKENRIGVIWFIFLAFACFIFLIIGIVGLFVSFQTKEYGNHFAFMYALSSSLYILLNFLIWLAKLVLYFFYGVLILSFEDENERSSDESVFSLPYILIIVLVKFPLSVGVLYLYVLYFAVVQKKLRDRTEKEMNEESEEDEEYSQRRVDVNGNTIEIKDILVSYSDIGRRGD